jgi:phosphate transport system protein
MLKELQKIFQRKGLMEQALDESIEMLKEDWEMFRESVKSLRESETAEIGINIEEKDLKINKFERNVRKKVLTHLAVNDVYDLNVGLVLISIVVDIERIGDYTKNIVELAQNHPGKLYIEKWEDQLKSIETAISKNFGVLIQALEESDEVLSKQLLDELWKTKKDCDGCVWSLMKDKKQQIDVPDAVALALYMRYLKRVASHLMNTATGIVNPFHRIGYREKVKK